MSINRLLFYLFLAVGLITVAAIPTSYLKNNMIRTLVKQIQNKKAFEPPALVLSTVPTPQPRPFYPLDVLGARAYDANEPYYMIF